MKMLYRQKPAAFAMMMVVCITSSAVAQAQTIQGTNRVPVSQASAPLPTPVPAKSDRARTWKRVDYTGGVNTGREIQFNTPGCVGPISYCNLYFGG
jgi:hypothetical protein